MAARVAEEPQEVAGAEFQGRVIDDSTGDALRSAEVRFHKAGMLELAADLDSDREGRIRATGLPEGHYTVEVSKPNYITASLQFQVPGNALLVRLVRYGAIGGRVADQQGNPVPGTIRVPTGRSIGGARVVVLAKFEGATQLHTVREGELADDGTYRFYDLTPGQYALGLWYDGIKEGSGVQLYPDNAHPRFFTVTGGEDYPNIDFMVLPQGTFRVAGRVEMPKQGDKWALSLALPEQPALPIARTVSEDDGSFHFDRIPPGAYDLLVGGPDRGYGAHTSVLGPTPYFSRSHLSVSANVENLVIAVTPARSVTVTLRAAAGETLPKGCPSTVQLLPEPLEPWAIDFPRSPMVSFDKEQAIQNLAPAKFRLRVMDLGSGCYQANEAIADLTGDRPAPVAIELAAAGQIHGSLRAAARPADFVIVLLEGTESADAQTRLAFPDANGHFAFDGLHPGRYRIAAQSAAESKARWVADVAHMTAVEVKGGVATEIQVSAPAKGDRQ
jgi:protocatechuate 3,4-dioxygenase beta subunit